ncbi:MAG: putative lipid II flippase FtsW [Candidatus Uhrbacteria bacterium]
MELRRPRWLDGDTSFLMAVALLIALGLIFLSSASAPLAYERFGSRSYYLWHQVYSGIIPGCILFFFFSRIRHEVLEKLAIPIFVIGVALLLLLFIPGFGLSLGGSRSWLNLRVATFQPSELVKIGLILAFAAWATTRRPSWFHIKSWTFGFLPFLAVLGVVLGLIVLQPDVGTLGILACIGVVMAFVAGIRWHHLGVLILGGFGMLVALIAAAPYRLARLTAFLHPELDPQGIGYQVNQALLAVGSGGWFGLGLGHSRQKFAFLPEVISDSIFAVIAEEIGFFFSLALLVLIAYIIWRVLRAAFDASDEFDRLILVGIAAWWGVQTFVNIGAMVGLMPITGLPLPFVSYGGSALAVGMAAVGIVNNLTRERVSSYRRR